MDTRDRTLIDQFLPEFDLEETHHITIHAPPSEVFRKVMRLDLSQIPVVRWLFALRSLPSRLRGSHAPRRMDFDGLKQIGFVELARTPDEEITLGIIGKFWSPVPKIESFAPDEFSGRLPVGAAKAAWNFRCASAVDGSTRLSTQTRVKLGTSGIAAALFRVYWLFVRPMSGLIRRSMLRHIRSQIESEAKASK